MSAEKRAFTFLKNKHPFFQKREKHKARLSISALRQMERSSDFSLGAQFSPPFSQSHLLYIPAVTGFEMQIAPSGRQLEEQRTIEERSEKWMWKRFRIPPREGGDLSAEGSRVGDLGLFHGSQQA